MTSLIEFQGLTKDYGRFRALDEISLKIGPGVTGILGPNGSGKSTMIKTMLGLVKLTGGSGTVLGLQIGKQSRAIRGQVGYMPEDDCYIAGMSGVEMVQFAAQLAGLPDVEGLRRAHEILDFCGAEQERYRQVETYSTGMRQKLKFAQAIVHDPPLLVLDEPTSGLDPEERQAMLTRIKVLANRAHKSVLISTHILPDVQSVCDSVVILVRGKVRLVESLDSLRKPSSPSFQLKVAGNADSMLERLRADGIESRVEVDGTISVSATGRNTPERVWQLALETETGVQSLAPARNSLEQIFIDTVNEGDNEIR